MFRFVLDSFCQSVCLSVSLSVCLSVCLAGCLALCLCVCLYLPVGFAGCLSVTLASQLSAVCLSLCSCLAVCAVNVHYRGSETPVREPDFRTKSGPPDKTVCCYTGRTKVALVELPTVNMFGFFFCTPFPLRILAWSFVVPGRISTLQKLLILWIEKRVIIDCPTPATRNGLGNVIRG